MSALIVFLKVLFTLFMIPFMVVLCTLCHESGHALTGIAFGGKVQLMEIFGVYIYPEPFHLYKYFSWNALGETMVTGISDNLKATLWMTFMGSGATFAMSLLFQLLFWVVQWRNYCVKTFLLLGCWWCMESFWHTMPTIGIRTFVFWGSSGLNPSFSEAYYAAVMLGLKGWIFQALNFGLCGILVVLSFTRLIALNTAPKCNNGYDKLNDEDEFSFSVESGHSSQGEFKNRVRKYLWVLCLVGITLVLAADGIAVGLGKHPEV